MMLEIQVLAWDSHKNVVELNWLMRSQLSPLIIYMQLYLSFTCLILFLEHETALNLMLKKQLHDMKEENETLKQNIHRLTVELSAYQAKFRPLSTEEKVKHYY